MKAKTMAVVAARPEYAAELKDNLLEYFGELVEIHAYGVEQTSAINFFCEDLVGVTYKALQSARPKVRNTQLLVAFDLIITKKNMKKLEDADGYDKALLVNIDQRSCLQAISEIYDLGYRNIELIPYFGVGEYDENIRLAITLDEEELVPKKIENIINIGNREINMNCILDIADKLGIKEELKSSESFISKRNTLFGSSSIEKILGENENLSDQVDTLMQLMEHGIVITDDMHRIVLFNKKAEAIIGSHTRLVKGQTVKRILSEIGFTPEAINDRENNQVIVSDGMHNYILTVNPILTKTGHGGKIIIIKDFEEEEEYQHDVRAKISKRSHVTKYSFSDIKGRSQAVSEVISAAKRMSRSEASVMITGESGTGKEIFAQSIHNFSPRKRYNFVAVNCAAIPENLLESELFGYEEGSFTGAKRGGKIGYFELAHKGTIFLDEIGEMPLLLQAKLLRVVEEKKIIKIGSQKIIDIDVRIISATNRDLFKLVQSGSFREDLYYRLSVLPIEIPPLRERKEDIMLLVEYFAGTFSSKMTFSKEAEQYICEYPWYGNIRELRNVIEYLTNLEKERIEKEDILRILKVRNLEEGQHGDDKTRDEAFTEAAATDSGQQNNDLIKTLFLKESSKLELYYFVLSELKKAYKDNRRLGRPGIFDTAKSQKKFFSETEIREALSHLSRCGFIRQGKGRGASVITEKGLRLLSQIKKGNWLN